jgi:hypothetical protein
MEKTPDEEPLVITFVPPLVALLHHSEQAKGAPLTRDEVLAIRGRGACIRLRLSHAREMAKKRGYEDIDPEYAWEQWQEVRKQLVDDGGAGSSAPPGP